jgi:peptide/nickel transport system substrate-binding protein
MPNPLSKNLQLFSWTIKAFLQKHIKTLILGLVIGLLGFIIIFKLIPYLPEPKQHLRIGHVGKYSMESLPNKIKQQVSMGLTIMDDHGIPQPGLAKSWHISDDSLIYTFTLFDNLYWHDGTKVTTYDINYPFKDVDIKYINDYSIEFKLKEPFAPFLATVSQPVFKNNLLGISRYQVEDIKKSGDYIESLVLSSADNKITYKFYPTIEMAQMGFKLGEIDMLQDLFVNPFDDNWRKSLNIQAIQVKDRYTALFFNNQDELLTNKEMRQALAYAINSRPADESRAYGPISPNCWAYNSNIKSYDFDVEKAQNLLSKFKENGKEIELTISTSEAFLSLAEDIKKSWEEVLGIKVSVELINTFDPNYQIFLGIQEIPRDPDQYYIWHSTADENITNFNDPRVDKLLEDGRRILDYDKRKEKYLDFQRFLLEESPAAFLYHPELYNISRQSVSMN